MKYEADYLVIGSGATGMAFVDTLLDETDATVIMIDDRAVPGGHWNEAYPYVRLHQPASTYGVNSKDLGARRIDTKGTNAGFEELSSGVEITRYYHALMEEKFIPSGRVMFLPLTRYTEKGKLVSRLTGETHDFKVLKKTVFANYVTTAIPALSKRKFDVAKDVTCIIPNDLPHHAPDHKNYCVICAGKTGTDSVNWLLERGVKTERISWVISRDAWFLNRESFQVEDRFYDSTIGGQSKSIEIYATSKSVREIEERMEAEKLWMRIDPNIWPSMFHAAIVSEREIEQLRTVKNIIRMGRVSKVNAEAMEMTDGIVSMDPDTLYIDCTTSGLGKYIGVRQPVFQPGEVHLQVVRQFQPCFSAAILAFIEAHIPEGEKNNFARPTPATDVVTDALLVFADALQNTFMWTQNADLTAWRNRSRLDKYSQLAASADKTDPKVIEIMTRVMTHAFPAVENLQRLGMDQSVAAE